ncbi:MAG: WxL protein peptidoglycan domain-containing protein [Mycobacteriales bacterium]
MNGRVLAAAAVALVSALVPAAPALAAGSAAGPAPGLLAVSAGARGYFDFAASPGTITTVTVDVRNLSASTQTYRVYSVGATTSPATGVSYDPRSTPPVGMGLWLQPAEVLVRLAPHQMRPVPFEVHLPARVRSGDHVGGIAAENAVQPSPVVLGGAHGAHAALIETTRVVVAVVVRTPGPAVTAIRLGATRVKMESGVRQAVLFPMVDTGGLLFKPRLIASVRPCAGGAPLLSVNRQLDTFVPRTSIDYAYYPRTNLPAGCYQATASIYRASALLSTRHDRFQVTSGQAVARPTSGSPARAGNSSSAAGNLVELLLGGLIGCLLVIALLLLLLLRRRSDKRQSASRTPADVPAPRLGEVPAPRVPQPASPPAAPSGPMPTRGVLVRPGNKAPRSTARPGPSPKQAPKVTAPKISPRRSSVHAEVGNTPPKPRKETSGGPRRKPRPGAE